MRKRKICVITGTRAEYGNLRWLLEGIDADPELELQIIVTGMHLSPYYGNTYKEIELDGFTIDQKVEILLSSDTPSALSKSTGLGVIGFGDAFASLKPDIIAVLGDRYEILAACISATFARIPIAHYHGGEATEGLIDEPIRHSITKMSHIHFVAAKKYQERVVQMGEAPQTVHLVGGMGVDSITRLQLLRKSDLERQLGFRFGEKNLIITFHPVTLEDSTAATQFNNLLDALTELMDYKFIFTKPNSDTEGHQISTLIDRFVEQNSNRSISFVSMGQLKYLSALQYVDAVVGNSSSGLAEAPTFKIGSINIGDRQRGRLKAESVIDCDPTVTAIKTAFKKLSSPDFQQRLKCVINPYGPPGACEKSIEILKSVNLSTILKKKFYDINSLT
jgi:GDP/UDP-N,N'-diacetylbacillosamine 2-epimerase (hydrolysing)